MAHRREKVAALSALGTVQASHRMVEQFVQRDELPGALVVAIAAVNEAKAAEQAVVNLMRATGSTWEQVADAAHLETRQAAAYRYGKRSGQ